MSEKRSFDDVDTDYQEFDFLTGHQSKRQKLLEHDAKEATIKKIETIIRREFARELCNKETEIDLIDERINEGRRLLDRLRACIVAQHYSKVLPTAGPSSSASALSDSHSTVIHPAVKKFIGKTVCSSSRSTHGRPSSSSATFSASHDADSSRSIDERSRLKETGQSKNTSTDSRVNQSQFGGGGGVTSSEQCSRGDRFKIVKKLIVGNVSKYLAPDKKEANDKSTHKWMVYVRGPKEESPIDEFVEKVCFFLHDSYFPNNVVEITQPPFHLTRRGWGEFQVRVQLHCRGPSRKIFNISHQLKLDRTYTGLQTMGAETVVEIKLDKEITGRLSRVLHHDPCDSPPRQETLAETMDELPPLIPIKEEKDDDGYEDPTATELATKSQDALRELAASSETIHCPSTASVLQTERRNIKRSIGTEPCDSEASVTDLLYSEVFSRISEIDSMPLNSTAATGSEQVQLTVFESSLQREISLVNSNRNSDSTIFVPERGPHEMKGLPVKPVFESASVECGISITCGEQVDCDNVHEEVVICDHAVNMERASFDMDSCDNVLEETVTSEDICIEPDYSSAELKGLCDLRNGGVEELVTCDDVHEEIVICDAIRVEPTLGNEELERSSNAQSNGEITDGACSQSMSFGGASGLVNDVETERAVDCINGTPTACDDDVVDMEPVISVGNRIEPVVNAEPDTRTLDVCPTPEAEHAVSTAAVGIPARTKETEEHGFFRCIDSSGRVFRIPRHLVQSASAARTNATIPIAQASKTMAADRLNNTLGIVSSEQRLVALPQMTPRLPLTSATSQINTTNNRFATCVNTTVNRVTMNSTGFQTLVNVATKEVGIVGSGGKLGYVSGATSIVGPGTRGIIRGASGDSIVVVSSPGSLSSKGAVILPVQPKTIALMAPGAIQGPSSFGVRVVTQNQSLKLGPALSSVRMTTVQSDRPKTVVVRSVSMGQSQVVLSSMRGGQLVRNSGGGGPVTFVTTTRPRAVAPIVRGLPLPGVSNCLAATSPVLSSAGPATRLLHSQVSSAVRSFPSQVIPVMRSLPSHVVSPVVGSLSSTVRPVQRSTQPNCSRPKLDSPPVFLLVPSEVKGRQVVVSPNSTQPAVRHVLLVPKGTKVSSSGLGLTSQLKTKAGVQPGKPLSGNHDVALASASAGIRLVTDSNSSRARAVSILRPPAPSTSSMTSLLKKNLFVPPPVSVSLPPGEGQPPGTSVSSNNIPPSAKSSAGKSVVQTRPPSLARAAETLLKTQIGSQTVIVKLDSSKKCGHAQAKVDDELKANDTCLLAPSVAVQENRISVARPREKHLMFKTLRESSSQRKQPENVTANISLQDLDSMEDIVRSLAKHFPVYGDNVDRSVHPYCASSWNGFLHWNIGKRRAAELCRTVAIQRKICSLLNGVEIFHGEAIWSKQQIIKWCRRHLYTPLDSEMAVHMTENETEKQSDPPDVFTSLTNHREALGCLDAMSRLSSTTQDNGNNDDEEDVVLDVITIEESPEKETKVKRLPVKVMTGAEVIPPSVEAQFVHETAAKIGIRLSPAPVSPDECPEVLSSTVEEMIAAATRAFANELVRTAAAKLFDIGRDPLQFDVTSICEAIRQMNRCDFLTNRSLGVHEDDMNPS